MKAGLSWLKVKKSVCLATRRLQSWISSESPSQPTSEQPVSHVVSGNSDGADIKQWSKEEFKVKFPSLFSGKLGCMEDVSVKLDIDPSIKPVRQPQRPVAIHLRQAVTKELLKQVEEGILERVTRNSGPTPWISNLVVVLKDNPSRNSKCSQSIPTAGAELRKELSVRLTCDSRAVNKAIRRTRYPGKTIEDLVYVVNGAKWFFKLDIMKAFYQMV